MKRLYVIVFLVIAATAALGLAIAEHSGYVLVAYKSFRYESSLWATLAWWRCCGCWCGASRRWSNWC